MIVCHYSMFGGGNAKNPHTKCRFDGGTCRKNPLLLQKQRNAKDDQQRNQRSQHALKKLGGNSRTHGQFLLSDGGHVITMIRRPSRLFCFSLYGAIVTQESIFAKHYFSIGNSFLERVVFMVEYTRFSSPASAMDWSEPSRYA